MTRARRGWTSSRIRCVAYAVRLIDETIAKVRADLTKSNSGNLDCLRDVDLYWNWARGALTKASDVLRRKRAEDERHRERKRGPGPRTPKHWGR